MTCLHHAHAFEPNVVRLAIQARQGDKRLAAAPVELTCVPR
jgi:hypothetical protein